MKGGGLERAGRLEVPGREEEERREIIKGARRVGVAGRRKAEETGLINLSGVKNERKKEG